MSPPSPARVPGGVSRHAAERYLAAEGQERIHRRHKAGILISTALRLLSPHWIVPRCPLAVKSFETMYFVPLESGNSPVAVVQCARARRSRGGEVRQEPNNELRVRGWMTAREREGEGGEAVWRVTRGWSTPRDHGPRLHNPRSTDTNFCPHAKL